MGGEIENVGLGEGWGFFLLVGVVVILYDSIILVDCY